uniref:probable methyltransferase-like protein 15 isoform X2 n=1 Tax=Oncorhynchus gorbuscha TaxID=8017 RepID=UPI001EAF1E11|nr:probable methyltransferase-like protein 15 isoform X2 [Oncorhynchus gorbuscha]
MACQHVSACPTLRSSWRVALDAACRVSQPWKGSRLSYSGFAPMEPGHQDRLKDDSTILAEQTLHTPVMLKEVLRCLDIQPGQVVLDMTFGGGGHTKAILRASPEVTVVALDRDPTAFSLAQQLAKEHSGRVHPLLGRFSELGALLSRLRLQSGSVDAVLLDAGCSSMQMDCPKRGFSLSKDGPLDMRMDADRYPDMPCAADVVNALDQQALASILTAYGEERHARKIASAMVEARSVYPITRTQQLASVVAGLLLSRTHTGWVLRQCWHYSGHGTPKLQIGNRAALQQPGRHCSLDPLPVNQCQGAGRSGRALHPAQIVLWHFKQYQMQT